MTREAAGRSVRRTDDGWAGGGSSVGLVELGRRRPDSSIGSTWSDSVEARAGLSFGQGWDGSASRLGRNVGNGNGVACQ